MATIHTPAHLSQLVAIADISALGGNCVLGSDSRFELAGGSIMGAMGKRYAALNNDLWRTDLGASREVLFKSDLFIRFENEVGDGHEIGPFPFAILRGHILWVPDQSIAGWYEESPAHWTDNQGTPWNKVVVRVYHN